MRFLPYGLLTDYAVSGLCIALTLFSMCSRWFLQWNNARRRLDQMRRYEVGFGKPSEQTQLAMGSGQFHRIEEEFAGVGFELLGDYVIAGGTKDEVSLHNAPLASPFGADVKEEFRFAHASVCRVLVHREHGCIASIASPLSSTPKENRVGIGLHYLIVSVGNGWTYSSHADLPPLMDVESSARDLASYEGKLPPAGLLKAHLSRRDELARAGGFAWEAPLSLEQIIEWETQRYARIRDWASQRSAFSLMRLERRGRRKPQRELLGDLRGKL